MVKLWPDADGAWNDPGAEGAHLKINEFLTFHLLRLASVAKSSVAREYLDPAGLSVPEWRLLATVANFSPLPFSDITAMTTMDKGSGEPHIALRAGQGPGGLRAGACRQTRYGRQHHVFDQSGGGQHHTLGRALYQKVMPVAQRYQVGLIAR